MGAQKAEHTLIYLHIPKCAGTSMMGILKANYGNGFYRVANGGGWRKFHKLPERKRASIACLTGHQPWGMHLHMPMPCHYAVMLRDPVDRVASLYWFVRSFPKHRWHKLVMRHGFAWFIQSGLFSDLDNGMTRWLAGRGDVGSLPVRGPVTDEDVRQAKTHLQAASVGFVETFKQSMQTWAREFGWCEIRAEHRMRGNYPNPRRNVQRLIEECNAFDVELYEWARGL